jgi:hypothetical protein
MTNTASNQTDQRGAPRMRTLKGARLVLANNMSTFECKVRNLSATGACVEMPSTLGVPSRVTLKMDDGSDDQLCHVAWRTDKRIGLHFIA